MGRKLSASVFSSAAPVGVHSSASTPPVVTGTPSSRWAVAGAGTGRRPWAVRTVPLPTATGEHATSSGARRWIK